MAIERGRDEADVLQRRCGQVGDDELQELLRECFELLYASDPVIMRGNVHVQDEMIVRRCVIRHS